MLVNHISIEGDEGVAWGNNMRTLWNKNHTEENFGCKY